MSDRNGCNGAESRSLAGMSAATTRVAGLTVIAAIACMLSACTRGPDFVRPSSPSVRDYLHRPPNLSDDRDESQSVKVGGTVAGDWWALFRSDRLDRLLKQAVAGNATLEAGMASLAQARQIVLEARGSRYPQIDATVGARRERAASAPTGSVQESSGGVYSVGATVSYAPDVFGATARQIEQAEALADNRRYQLAATYLALTGNAVVQAIGVATVRAQIAAAADVVDDSTRNVALVKAKSAAGKAPGIDVLTAEAQLAADRAALPPLRQQLSVARHALSVLVGRVPSEWSAPDFDLTEFELPRELPLSLPSEFVHRRPDILAAEAELHAASAAVGIAEAKLYPNLTLSATTALDAATLAGLWSGGALAGSVGAGLATPLFRGGTLRAERAAAEDAYRATAAQYRQTVLSAFGQVADTLRALEHDAELVSAERAALASASAARDAQRESYRAGKSTVLQLVDAERAYHQARAAFGRAVGQRLTDSATLVVAMGGGWWEAAPLAGP